MSSRTRRKRGRKAFSRSSTSPAVPIVETDALVEALEQGHLGGYSGDVWDLQPAPPDHPWRTMPNHALTSRAPRSKPRSATPPAFATAWRALSRGGRYATTT